MGRLGLLVLALLLAAPAFAQDLKGPNDQLGADGFPADWDPQDLENPPVLVVPPASRTVLPAKPQPVTFRVDQMRSVALAPSGSMPVALPPERGGARGGVSGTIYRPLAAVFAGGTSATLAPGAAPEGTENGPLNNDLAALAAYGPLAPASGGFAGEVWGAVSSTVAAGLSRQAVMTPSPALREAWRRLLLSQAVPPGGIVSATLVGPDHWLVVRARLLQQLGLDEAAWSLWRQAGPGARSQNPDLAKGWVQAGMLAGAQASVCPLAREKAAAGEGDSFWPSAVAVCAAAEAQAGGGSGSAAALGLSLQLLPAEVQKNDPALVAALTAVRDGKPLVLGLAPLSPLAGAVAAAYPVLLSPTALPLLPDVALRRLRETQALPVELRAEVAGQLATRTGWPQDGEAFLRLVSGTGLQGKPERWPDAALVAWAAHASTTQSVSASRLIVPAALRLGDVSTALARWNAWQPTATETDGGRARLDAEVALHALNRADVPEPLLQSWLAVQDLATPAGAERAQRGLLMLEGLGMKVPAGLWEAYRARAVEVSDATDAGWRRLLENAVAARNAPAVMGLLGEGMGNRRAADLPPATAGAAVVALRAIGLPDLAKRLLAEALTLLPESGGAGLDARAADGRVLRKALPMEALETSVTAGVSATGVVKRKTAEREDGLLPPPRVKAPTRPTVPTVRKPSL